MQIYNFPQGTPEWYAIRAKKMTASHAQAIGNNGKGLKTYIDELMAEYYSSQEKEQYSNEHIQRGHELEGTARGLYELQNDCIVDQVGFIEESQYIGCSPDGLVGEYGLIEIKSQDDKKHFRLCIYGIDEIDSAYIWQMQMQMWITGRQWCDFVSFNPNFKQSLVIHRIERDEEKIAKLRVGCEEGQKMIQEIIAKYSLIS